jgi:TonB family protein
MDLSFGPAIRHPPEAPRSRGMDLSLGPVVRGGKIMESHARIDAAAAGADWRSALAAWVEQHKYYPAQAAMNGEDGNTTVLVTMRPDGKVLSVEMETRSGSQWLDMATLGMFRDAMLPELPLNMRKQNFTFHFTMRYVLIRQ